MITEKHIRLLEGIADGKLRVKELTQGDRPEGWRVQLAVVLNGMGGVPRGRAEADPADLYSSHENFRCEK